MFARQVVPPRGAPPSPEHRKAAPLTPRTWPTLIALERSLHRHATVALAMCSELELGAAAAVCVRDVYHAVTLVPGEEAAAGGASPGR